MKKEKMNRKIIGISVFASVVFLSLVIVAFYMTKPVYRVRVSFVPEVSEGIPVAGATYNGYLTIYNVGSALHNVSVKYEEKTGEWYPPVKIVYFGDIFTGENKTIFVEKFYFIPRYEPNLKRFPVFTIMTNEGNVTITTDNFVNRDWTLE